MGKAQNLPDIPGLPAGRTGQGAFEVSPYHRPTLPHIAANARPFHTVTLLSYHREVFAEATSRRFHSRRFQSQFVCGDPPKKCLLPKKVLRASGENGPIHSGDVIAAFTKIGEYK